MTELLRPGTGLVYMKVGMHAGEDLETIISRKRKEISDEGMAFWGYGGNTCHPLTMVQPFAEQFVSQSGIIYLAMQPMNSGHTAVTQRAIEFSADGLSWNPVPAGINAIGSRYALTIDSLDEEQIELPLNQTRVAIGNSMGRRGDHYIAGRVDKACLEVVDDPEADGPESKAVDIKLVARLTTPYAVLLR